MIAVITIYICLWERDIVLSGVYELLNFALYKVQFGIERLLVTRCGCLVRSSRSGFWHV